PSSGIVNTAWIENAGSPGNSGVLAGSLTWLRNTARSNAGSWTGARSALEACCRNPAAVPPPATNRIIPDITATVLRTDVDTAPSFHPPAHPPARPGARRSPDASAENARTRRREWRAGSERRPSVRCLLVAAGLDDVVGRVVRDRDRPELARLVVLDRKSVV